MVKAASKAFKFIFVVAYPVVVFYGLRRHNTRQISLIILTAVIIGALSAARGANRQHLWEILRLPLMVIGSIVIAVSLDDFRFILFLPVIISAELLFGFASSLREPVSMIERYARMVEPDLSEEKITYCRKVTIAWCVFFVVNGAIAGALALFAPLVWWTIYAGLISYVLIGVMFATEYAIRRFRFR